MTGVTHHDLCFGCGVANLFGLQLELERDEQGASGRFFLKQDHQGPPGYAHGGIVAAALDETMALLVHAEGLLALTRRLSIDLRGPAPVGTFGFVRAWIEEREGRRLKLGSELTTRADGEPRTLATATGEFTVLDS